MTPADFIAAFPAFKDTQVPDIQRHLNASPPYFDVDRWGGFYNEGLGNWVAHRLIVEKRHAASQNDVALKGDVTSEETQGITTARSSAVLEAVVLDRYKATTYGQEYRRLSKRVGLGALTI